MEQPTYVLGSADRFRSFISALGKEKRIIVSHTDLDGLAAAKITDKAIKADDIIFVNYSDLTEGIDDKLRKTGAKKVIFTDLFFKKTEVIKKIEEFADVLIIDHHTPEIDLNSAKTVHINAQGFCATYLCYCLFGEIADLSKLDWLVAAASIADVQYSKNQDFMSETLQKYGDKFSTDNKLIKKTRFYTYSWKISLALMYYYHNLRYAFDKLNNFEDYEGLDEEIMEVQKDYDIQISRFEKNRQPIKNSSLGEGYFSEISPKFGISSFLSTELSFEEQHKTFIFMQRFGDLFKFSARRQDGEKDLNKLCKSLVEGFEKSDAGGHPRASAGAFPAKYLPEFKKRLGVL